MLTRVKDKPAAKAELPFYLQHAHARHQDRAAKRQLLKAIEKKARTAAVLKRLGLPLED
jgi:hypothetical protein